MPCAFHYNLGTACPFNVPDNELLPGKNQNWCLFHLPEQVKQSWDKGDGRAIEFSTALKTWLADRTDHDRSVPLAGVVFPTDFSFSDLVLNDADLRRCVFMHEVDFSGCTFADRINFEGTIFRSASKFTEVNFERRVNFRNTGFGGGADFQHCKFHDRTEFESNFSEGVSFAGSLFRSAVSVKGVLSVYSHFNGCKFLDVANFYGIKFQSLADYAKSEFHKVAYFANALFSQGADFNNARFADETSFVKSRFVGPATFAEATFDGNADFTGGKGSEGSDLFVAANFSGAKFSADARFSNRTFTDQTSFRAATFTKAPKFHNCRLHQDTVFRDAKFIDLSSDAEHAYRTLKLAMEADRARYEQSEFFAMEQTCRRKRLWEDGRYGDWITSGIYDVSARYGQSFLRPIFCIFVSLFVFWIAYLSIAFAVLPANFPIAIRDVAEFAFEQVFRPFHIWAGGGRQSDHEWVAAVISESPLLLRLTATIHSLISLGLFAISLVALRRRFHMG